MLGSLVFSPSDNKIDQHQETGSSVKFLYRIVPLGYAANLVVILVLFILGY